MKPVIICQVYFHKSANQKLVTIPKDSNIVQGDYVLIKKVEVREDEL